MTKFEVYLKGLTDIKQQIVFSMPSHMSVYKVWTVELVTPGKWTNPKDAMLLRLFFHYNVFQVNMS